jgi:hypothetical protein
MDIFWTLWELTEDGQWAKVGETRHEEKASEFIDDADDGLRKVTASDEVDLLNALRSQ